MGQEVPADIIPAVAAQLAEAAFAPREGPPRTTLVLGQQARSTLPRPRGPREEAPWLAIAGAKGGVGKTTLAVNLAALFARSGHRTLLVDFDPGCGNVGVHLRLAGRWDLEDVATGRCRAGDAVLDGPGGLKVVLGRSGSTTLAGGDPGLLQAAIDAIAELANGFDLVVCDTGAGIGPATLAPRSARMSCSP
ncbi:MAG: AAA family ATPase [Gemmatimonadetes bacterium]|nr:AAA family ATPase [Gemmatimonadota bacterium]